MTIAATPADLTLVYNSTISVLIDADGMAAACSELRGRASDGRPLFQTERERSARILSEWQPLDERIALAAYDESLVHIRFLVYPWSAGRPPTASPGHECDKPQPTDDRDHLGQESSAMAAAARARSGKLLRQKYGAYYHREIPQEDGELTHVGPGTPCGEYLRRFWQPVAFGDELSDLPVRMRILGEDLVLFRDEAGQFGLLELHCAHRGASLEYGRVEDRGIRCCYHGWHYDVDGPILDMPGEPPGSKFKDRFCHGAYPTLEYQGLIFTYMGPPDMRPELPIYDIFQAPGTRLEPGVKYVMPCNWLQIEENFMDPAHLLFLHTLNSGPQFTSAYATLAQTEYQETPIGSIYIDSRRVGGHAWIRTGEQILPNINQFPRVDEDGTVEKIRDVAIQFNWAVPVDDTHTLRIGFLCAREGDTRDWWATSTQGRNLALDRPYEERQRRPGDYEAQVGQRPIAIHALEHLGGTDRGVTMFRGGICDGIRAVRGGRDPKGVVREPNRVIPTYTQHTILRVPRAATPAEDRERLLQVGRLVANGEYDLEAAGLRYRAAAGIG